LGGPLSAQWVLVRDAASTHPAPLLPNFKHLSTPLSLNIFDTLPPLFFSPFFLSPIFPFHFLLVASNCSTTSLGIQYRVWMVEGPSGFQGQILVGVWVDEVPRSWSTYRILSQMLIYQLTTHGQCTLTPHQLAKFLNQIYEDLTNHLVVSEEGSRPPHGQLHPWDQWVIFSGWLWCCWLGGKKGIPTIKRAPIIYLQRFSFGRPDPKVAQSGKGQLMK